MAEIDTPMKYPPPDKNKRERRTTVCALCVWIIVLTFCWVFLTSESLVEDFESAVAYLVMWPFVMVMFIISISRQERQYRSSTSTGE